MGEPVFKPALARGLMKMIICIFLVISLAASFGIWKLASNTRLCTSQIKNAEGIIAGLKLESKNLDKYKCEKSLPLDKFYLQVFNDLKEISFYYHASSEIKVLEAKDLVATEDFFKPSQYEGIRYVDILCRIDLKNSHNLYLFEMLYKIIKNKPIEILEVEVGKDTLNVTMRLYGL